MDYFYDKLFFLNKEFTKKINISGKKITQNCIPKHLILSILSTIYSDIVSSYHIKLVFCSVITFSERSEVCQIYIVI